MNQFQQQALEFIRRSGPLAEGPNRTSAGNQLGHAIGCHRNAAMRILGELERAGHVELRRRGRTITRAWIADSEEQIQMPQVRGPDAQQQEEGESGMTISLLVATVGLPGSGKTTWARDYQRIAIEPTAIIERDTFRDMFGYRWDAHHDQRNAWEEAITRAQKAVVRELLGHGHDVIVADTNLIDEHLRSWAGVAESVDAKFEVRPFLAVPLDECIRRDAQRPPYEPGGPCSGRSVGADVIRRMWEKYQATHPAEAPR